MGYIIFLGQIIVTVVGIITAIWATKVLLSWGKEYSHKRNVEMCYTLMCQYIATYQTRFSGENRFLFNVDLMHELWPEYDMEVIKVVFDKLIAQEKINRNPIDQEWQLKPPMEVYHGVRGESIPKVDV